ncbi:type II secretion system F family protein [Caulobacter segnis]|uniref:type II secretion system F family protein n=1 Tax=Caulobacter segnis TaxID=88688 RepID=UPI001CBC536D|nr:type II secretion system F family protein [Caulobacter segnis]UAL09705.1 type II secretion system F family protein [Caulobacter segnis]
MLYVIAGALGFLMIAGLGFAFVGGDGGSAKASKRAQLIAGGGERQARVRDKAAANTPDARRQAILKALKEQERRQKKSLLSIGSRMQAAGLGENVRMFWIVSGVLGVFVTLMVLLLGQSPLVALGAGFAAGAGLPRWVLAILAKGRTAKFTAAFSDAIDIIVRGVKSGLPVHDCLKIIGKESPEPLAGEFRMLTENIGMGVPMDAALDKMYERMPTSELRFFAIVLAIQQKTGGNLAEALSNLSGVLRARKLMKEKIKALSAEAVASAMIIGSLPPGVVTLISVTSPAYMRPMFTDPRGHLMLLAGGIWMALGIFVMRRMINFKF